MNKQNPLVRQLLQNPEVYQDDFLELPRKKQSSLLKILEHEGEIDTRILTPPEQNKNPLLKLLSPNNNDKKDKHFLSLPKINKDPLLRQLIKYPKDYQDDFLELPMKMQDAVIKIVQDNTRHFNTNNLMPANRDRNPLKRLLSPNKNDNYDKQHFLAPQYKQDPLLRQLMNHPEEYSDDFLDLPQQMQSEVVEILELQGSSEASIEKLVPLTAERNPLLRILAPNDKDEMYKDSFKLPSAKQSPLLKQLTKHPEEFKYDFLELPSRMQDTLLKILKKGGVSKSKIRNL